MRTNFGIQLSRQEMKNITGGKYAYQIACTCTGSTHTGDSTICGFDTFQGGLNCGKAALDYCGGTASCVAGDY